MLIGFEGGSVRSLSWNNQMDAGGTIFYLQLPGEVSCTGGKMQEWAKQMLGVT